MTFDVDNVDLLSGWNRVTVRVRGRKISLDLNGREIHSARISEPPDPMSLGDRLSIGAHGWRGGKVWDGGLAHFLLFDRCLSKEEVELVTRVVGEDTL